MNTLDDLGDRLTSYLPAKEIQQVRRAYYYAQQAHDGQWRSSGEPYVTHPLAVATILAGMHMDAATLCAALLHDVIEDTQVSKQGLAGQFGDEIAEIVDGVSKLTQIEFASKEEAQAENFRKMVMAMSNDIRVIIVKLADRLHNMRTLGALRPDKKRRIAKETLDIYAPIANRLGINTLRLELEDLSFQAIYPMRHLQLKRAVAKAKGNKKKVLQEIQAKLQQKLEEAGISGSVIGREKNLLSLYNKMKEQRKSFHDIMDVFAFRIITDTLDDCYRLLGLVHTTYKPVPGRFKDYIAIPKANGYQSLHTSLYGQKGMPIEVQIRTKEMEAMANNGVAAHWLYKAGQTERPIALGSKARADMWVQSLLEIQQSSDDSVDFVESVKADLFPEEVYVFTPQGKIIELLKGATPIDFAYAVHTDIGNSCVACRINKRLAPLSARLHSGQTVEIITSPGAQPNLSWLDFVATARARSAIRHQFKQRQRSESESLGRSLLEKALIQFDTQLEQLDPAQINKVLQELGVTSQVELLENIGLGKLMAYAVARKLLSNLTATPEETQAKLNPSSIVIKGTEGAVVSFARCCNPIPGDAILGHLSFGAGIVVHKENCRNLTPIRDNEEKCLSLEWAEDVQGEYNVTLQVQMKRQRGLVARLAGITAAMQVGIDRVSIDERDAQLATLSLNIRVKNRLHLAKLMRKIKLIPDVAKLERLN